ncbi:MAG: AbiV family abortive infection protein [Bdellovibrionales bacterium]|nr:AbiV family abortive infection protein [Bdellovibrionales bacterium]
MNKTVKPERQQLVRILKNSKALLEEAELLLNNGYTRRAGFLALTSIEEVLKVMAIENGQDPRKSHHKKFLPLSSTFDDMFDEILSKNFFEMLGPQASEIKTDQQATLNQAWNEIIGDLKKVWKAENLRQSFLYEDILPPAEVLRFGASIESALPKLMVKLARDTHKAIVISEFNT